MNSVLTILFRILEGLFFIGIAGSLMVIAITTVEDFGLLFEKDEPTQGTAIVSRAAEKTAPSVASGEHI